MAKCNENKTGYKNTHLGLLPLDWKVIPLEMIVDKKRPICYGIVQTGNHKNANIPCVRVIDLTMPTIKTSQLIKTTEEINKKYKRTILIKGDIIFALRGEIGCTKIVNSNLEGANLTRGVALISKSNLIIPEFMIYVLSFYPVKKEIYFSTNGSALKEVPITLLRKIPIPLPPLPEQNKIAQILSAWDRAIEQTRQLIEAKKRIKKGLMQKLLTGKMRFPEFGKPLNDEKLPGGWKISHLGDCFKERNEINPELPLLAITGGQGVIPRNELDRKDTSTEDKSKYKVIKPGDIGYNTMRMWQGVSALSELEGIVSPAYTMCTPKHGHSSDYFSYLFKYPPMINLFYRYSQGLVSDTLNLKFHHFAQIKYPIPGKQEQKIVADFLKMIDKEINLLLNKQNQLIKQKKGLMQKLITGQIRVKVNG